LEEKLNVERMARTQQLSDAEYKLLAENTQLQVGSTQYANATLVMFLLLIVFTESS
jgi:hypothetical protein